MCVCSTLVHVRASVCTSVGHLIRAEVGGQFSEVSSHLYKARFLLFLWLWWLLLAGQPITAPGRCSRLCLQSWRRCLPPKSATSLGCRDETWATRLVWLMFFNHLNHLHSPDNKTLLAFFYVLATLVLALGLLRWDSIVV